MKPIVALLSGFLFALGLGLSGMTQPQKIVGFLDLFGDWDPTLIFVMIGAIFVHGLSYLFIKKRQSPVLTSNFSIPEKSKITKSLIIGSFLFGVGWGLSGFCPGPGVVSVFSGNQASYTFVLFMLAGIWLNRVIVKG